MPRQNPIQIGACTGAFKPMLSKISNLYSPHSIAHRRHFARHIFMAAIALKARVFIRILRAIGKPQRMFQPKTLIHPCAFGHKPIMQRGGFLNAPLRQGFIGKGHHKPTFIVFS